MLTTKDPNKAAINLGKLGLTTSVPEDQLTEEQKKQRDASEATQKMKKGGMVSSASKRADGVARTGKTKGRFV